MTWEFPWKQPESIYQNDGPRPGEVSEFVLRGVLFRVQATKSYAFQTGRRQYRVECLDCPEVIHEQTTSASSRVRHHLSEKHKIEVSRG